MDLPPTQSSAGARAVTAAIWPTASCRHVLVVMPSSERFTYTQDQPTPALKLAVVPLTARKWAATAAN